jgi:putative FmdB family regulatory protein
MPVYDYKCLDCKKKFTLTLSVAEHDRTRTKCPKLRKQEGRATDGRLLCGDFKEELSMMQRGDA